MPTTQDDYKFTAIDIAEVVVPVPALVPCKTCGNMWPSEEHDRIVFTRCAYCKKTWLIGVASKLFPSST